MDEQTYDVVIVGGGAAGLSAALVLGRARRRVAIVDSGAPRNAPAAHMQGYLSRDGLAPAALLAIGRKEVTGYGVEIVEDVVVGVEAGFTVPRAAVFVRPLMTPHPDGLLDALGCDIDDGGFPVTDGSGLTSVPGVWAAGNAADPRAQVITAAGQGSAAAIVINNDLVQDDIATAVDASQRQDDPARVVEFYGGLERLVAGDDAEGDEAFAP